MTGTRPNHVVLVHGLWVTPRSWENWVPYLEGKGFTVHTPAYPGLEIEVEALREDHDRIASLTVRETLAHLADVIGTLDSAPIIIGHSFGGTLTQLLLARGLGAAGVAIDSAPTEGVRVSPPAQVKALFPVLKNPANRRKAVEFTPEEFHDAFTNTLTAEESEAVRDRYAIPAPGYWVWEYGILANLKPGHQDTWVDYSADRAPLLFIAGGEDHIMPPAVNRSNAKHYKRSPAVTDYHEFEGRDHWTCGAPGWEAVADRALDWALAQATGPARPTATTA
ncbi:pimeloyl-ACP methyl ester carboxylesterase [Geodermatophilus bullaregiensis]|uniref:alpha/beta hydrolase n=1 Tax=Geodermatophilus bullaregiensis TaxID=1564160 RepID=UPI0027DC4C68|nr:alpha/beta fold hydrolase [Geodermatophilus bullaregiensis]MBM7807502.1 pimeloyl-ACP methyl ester carboxylesterase [Geodermatophilus bullaregiensis]